MILQDQASCGISSQTISRIDYFSFLLGIRRLINNEISFSFNCQKCGEQFQNSFDLQQKFQQQIQNFNRKHIIFQKKDNFGVTWKFDLNSYTMKDYLYYQYYLNEIQNVKDQQYSDQNILNPLLYITKIWKNDQEIEDWKQQTFLDKLLFFKSIPIQIISSSSKNETSLIQFILQNFDEEKINAFTSSIEVECTCCGQKYSNVYNFKDLFYVLGYAKDNQQIYANILQTQSYLIYYHWLTIDQINNMSYLDFTIYSQRIFALYEQQQKRKEQELKNQENQIQQIEIISD